MRRTAFATLTGEDIASEPGSGARPADGLTHLAHAASSVENLVPSPDRHPGTATRDKPGSTQPAPATAPTHSPPGAVALSFDALVDAAVAVANA